MNRTVFNKEDPGFDNKARNHVHTANLEAQLLNFSGNLNSSFLELTDCTGLLEFLDFTRTLKNVFFSLVTHPISLLN